MRGPKSDKKKVPMIPLTALRPCIKHPAYKGAQEPRLKCYGCWALYRRKQDLRKEFAKRFGKLLPLLLLTLACADLGPEKAKIKSLAVYACAEPCPEDQFQRRIGSTLTRPPNDGSFFYLQAVAPGALLIQQAFYWPSTLGEGFLEPDPVRADTLGQWWRLSMPLQALKWRVTLPWTGDRVLDADSLVWGWS